MSEVWPLICTIDLDDLRERYDGQITGAGMRNYLYYHGMKHSGVTGKGNNVAAPAYYRAAAAAAFGYGKGGIDDIVPDAHVTAYEAEDAPQNEEVEVLIETLRAI